MIKRLTRVLAVLAVVSLLTSTVYAKHPHDRDDDDDDDHLTSTPEPSAFILLGTALAGTALLLRRKHKE